MVVNYNLIDWYQQHCKRKGHNWILIYIASQYLSFEQYTFIIQGLRDFPFSLLTEF